MADGLTTAGVPKSTGAAPDGDEWFATALIFAHNRWGDTSGKFNYGTEAKAILGTILKTDFDAPTHLVRYYAGTSSNGTDGSYDLPAFYQVWSVLRHRQRDLLERRRFGGAHVLPQRGPTRPASSPTSLQEVHGCGDEHLGGRQASLRREHHVRPQLLQRRSVADGDLRARIWPSANRAGPPRPPSSRAMALLGFGLPAATGKPFVQNLWSVAIPSGMWRYYDGTLYTLALLHVSGAFHTLVLTVSPAPRRRPRPAPCARRDRASPCPSSSAPA